MRRPGEVLSGRYELLHRLGIGGAGAVWQAMDRILERQVAIKVLLPELADDPQTAARFRAEASAAGKLTHPNVVVVYDIGRDRGRDYLVMELVDGPSASQLFAEGPMASGAAAHLGRSVAAGLGAAHAAGMVHRDVKPANVLLTRDGTPKLADFGIARALGDATARLTRPGNVVGTARYLAPEQLRDDPLDARADVYSLGLLLHEALTGGPPFGDGTAAEIASRRLAADLAPPSSAGIELPPGLDAVVARATRLDPGERHADGLELSTALAPFVDQTGVQELGRLAGRLAAVAPVRTPTVPADAPGDGRADGADPRSHDEADPRSHDEADPRSHDEADPRSHDATHVANPRPAHQPRRTEPTAVANTAADDAPTRVAPADRNGQRTHDGRSSRSRGRRNRAGAEPGRRRRRRRSPLRRLFRALMTTFVVLLVLVIAAVVIGFITLDVPFPPDLADLRELLRRLGIEQWGQDLYDRWSGSLIEMAPW
jgi:serine/threonine protein kinase